MCSLTFLLRICRRLADFGEKACREGFGIEPFEEKHRNIHTFARRVSRLPEQRDGDTADYRSLLHRDGSVLSAVSLKVNPQCSTCQPSLPAAEVPGHCIITAAVDMKKAL